MSVRNIPKRTHDEVLETSKKIKMTESDYESKAQAQDRRAVQTFLAMTHEEREALLKTVQVQNKKNVLTDLFSKYPKFFGEEESFRIKRIAREKKIEQISDKIPENYIKILSNLYNSLNSYNDMINSLEKNDKRDDDIYYWLANNTLAIEPSIHEIIDILLVKYS